MMTFIKNNNSNTTTTSTTKKKLKCIVLGGAGAGKTSILRRYFHNTFDISRTPTVGSDFYAKRINLPEEVEDQYQENGKEEEEEEFRQQQQEEEKKETTSASSSSSSPFFSLSSMKNHHHYHNNNTPTNANNNNSSNNTISIQVWDTPGRERYAIDRDINNHNNTTTNQSNNNNNNNNITSEAFSDRFFQNADIALLVYDVTSSTSFTQVLMWHADLMNRANSSSSTNNHNHNHSNNKRKHKKKPKKQKQRQRQRPSFPILIVGNKIDVWKNSIAEKQKSLLQQSTANNVKKRRDVMGLSGKDFKGKDLRYEYSASPPTSKRLSSSVSNNNNNNKSSHSSSIGSRGGTGGVPKGKNGRFELSTYMGTGDQTSYLEAVLTNQVARGTYLESLLTIEDVSSPDSDLVMLWCMRNGLPHYEVSALDGTGVDKLMKEMVKIALEFEKQQQQQQQQQDQEEEEDFEEKELEPIQEETYNPTIPYHDCYDDIEKIIRNDELDLHRRYTPEPRSWLTLPFNGCCKPKVK